MPENLEENGILKKLDGIVLYFCINRNYLSIQGVIGVIRVAVGTGVTSCPYRAPFFK
ncbi:MAG: hypothetical protein WC785_02135 [Tatlockia sp.]